MLKGKPSPVFTKSGLKGFQNIQVNTDLFAHADHSKFYIFDERSVIFGGMNIADDKVIEAVKRAAGATRT